MVGCVVGGIFFAQMVCATVAHWAVPPMSGVQRLPDARPDDGVAGGAVRIVMAKGEYEPGSFVLCADEDLRKVELEVGDLKNRTGDIFPCNDQATGSMHAPMTELLKLVPIVEHHQNPSQVFLLHLPTSNHPLDTHFAHRVQSRSAPLHKSRLSPLSSRHKDLA